jgi:hypothetical protein
VISLARGTHPRGVVRIDTPRPCIPIRALYWAWIWVSAGSTKKQIRDHRTPSAMSREFAQGAHRSTPLNSIGLMMLCEDSDLIKASSVSLRESRALPCATSHGKDACTHGNGFAVRALTATSARQSLRRQSRLCRAHAKTARQSPLPCVNIAAVREHLCRAPILCRAAGRLPWASSLPCATRALPCACQCRAPSQCRAAHLCRAA